MKKLLMPLTFFSVTTALAYNSEVVVKYKSSLSVHKIESSAIKSLISKHLIQYPGLRIYNPRFAPKEFNNVIITISSKNRVCNVDTFEYDLYLNKTLFEMPAIQRSIKTSMKATGYKPIKVNEYGVTMWQNAKGEYIVNFVTKITPFTYVNSICKV